MSNQYEISPVNHSALGGAVNVTAGAIGGAVKKGLLTTVLWTGAFATLGAIALPFAITGTPVLLAISGAFAGAAAGLGSAWLPGGIATLIGGIKGGVHASDRVDAERFAAAQAHMQIEAMRAETMAQAYGTAAQRSAAGMKYDFPPRGSAMNAASPVLSTANDRQLQGTVAADRQLQVG